MAVEDLRPAEGDFPERYIHKRWGYWCMELSTTDASWCFLVYRHPNVGYEHHEYYIAESRFKEDNWLHHISMKARADEENNPPERRSWGPFAVSNLKRALDEITARPRPGLREKYGRLRKSATVRKIAVALTASEYEQLVVGNVCHYCGSPLPFRGHGVDRMNPKMGYSVENCVPCCGPCNKGKSTLSYEDWIAVVAGRLERTGKVHND